MSHPLDSEYNITSRLCVGLEIHVELATRSKMWTAAPNVAHPDYFDAEPNTLCDPVVVGMPGTLPVLNRDAVDMSMRIGRALACQIARFTKWDRKSYYYPDLPKNYQISQYDLPLCYDGALDIYINPQTDDTGEFFQPDVKRIGIIRAHLEEDAGKLLHEAPGGVAIDHSIVDLNRAGTPLLEIVTAPDFTSADECVIFCQTLRHICRHLGVTQGIMQRGHMRFEPNINVIIDRDGREYRTPVVEVKNLNSFRAVHGAISYEYGRQIEEWIETGVVMGKRAKSTRGWDDNKQITTFQRSKEDADEYRYFPDPDLVPLQISDEWLSSVDDRVGELPHHKQHRYVNEFGIGQQEAAQLIDEPGLTALFEQVIALGADEKRAGAMLLNAGAKRANERGVPIHELGITAEQINGILDLQAADKINSSAADQLFGHCCESDADPAALAEQHGLVQVSDDSALDGWIDAAIDAEPKAAEDVRQGKMAAIGRLIGAVMKQSKGQANAKVVQAKLRERLS